jgi:predicted XRE-type DNA-binding protein
MTAETTGALDRASLRAANPTPVRDSVMRIATMSRQLLDELRTRPLDAAGLNRLRAIDSKIAGELLTDLDPDLRQELQRLVQPLTGHTERSDAELRLAYAQLVGWLEGHLHATESALSDPHATLAVDGASASSDITPSPDRRHRPDVEPSGPTTLLPDDDASLQKDSAARSARRALITAITGRIAQQRLTAAQAAALLHLTGPKVTKLLQANADEFTLDELVTLLPALELTIHVAPAPQRRAVPMSANDATEPTRGRPAS